MLKHIKFPFLVSSTRFVLTHGTHFMRRKRIFVMEIRDSNTGGEEGALDLFFLSIFKSLMNMKKLSWRMQLCYVSSPVTGTGAMHKRRVLSLLARGCY